MSETVRVELGARSYDIHVGSGLLQQAGKLAAGIVKEKRVFVVTDERVAPLHAMRLEDGLRAAGIAPLRITLPAGEATKNWDQLGRLLDQLLDSRPERRSILLALGGGVIGDITGLAASLLLRGVDFIQAPTTLLAQVDSAVGGKTAVDARQGKNLIGSFHQPRLVLCDLDALATLPRRELQAGYAEVVKYGLINDPGFFAWCDANAARLLDGDRAAQAHAIAESCRAKARIVGADEREAGDRALLNLGHTFGHAFEAALAFDDALLHGEAVAIGTCCAFDLSVRLGLCPPEDARRVRRHLAAAGLPTTLPQSDWAADRLLALMAQDKKARGGLTFILARGIGKAFVAHDVPVEPVRELLAAAIAA
ncbi:MAG: 3-dehydroquinate synthase [Alphaproteobacteria bacterium]|nr:3-dehydroquinate synthase [Alphaproteobacteria bacterium]